MSSLEHKGSATALKSPVTVKYTKLFINGQYVDSVSGKTFETLDPRTGEVIAHVAEASKEDVDLAVQAARHAFDHGPWPRLPGIERGRILNKLADLVEKNTEELAALETWDNGKPLKKAQHSDLPGCVKRIRYYAGWADKIHGQTCKMEGSYQGYTLHEPIGVVGQIIPWNYPLSVFFTKIAPALACGCTVVIKPAEQTPLTALYCAQLAKEAGIPDGVLNVVTGFGVPTGQAISMHMDIDKIDKAQYEKILKYIEYGKREGAKLETGGNKWGNNGFYIQPTIFSEVSDQMKISQDEIFGPVMSVLKFKTVDEVIERANKTSYGLAGGVMTKNIDIANKVSRSLRAGIVWINCFLIIGVDTPFGGYKMSGIGRENGSHGLQNYLQVKSVITPLHDSPWL